MTTACTCAIINTEQAKVNYYEPRLASFKCFAREARWYQRLLELGTDLGRSANYESSRPAWLQLPWLESKPNVESTICLWLAMNAMAWRRRNIASSIATVAGPLLALLPRMGPDRYLRRTFHPRRWLISVTHCCEHFGHRSRRLIHFRDC